MGPLDVLQDMTCKLDRAGIDFFLVGSLAAMHYSRPRFTNDIDLVVHIQAQKVIEFENLFELDEYYCPPIEVIRDEVLRRGTFNLIHQDSGVKIDIVLLKNTEFYESEFQRRRKVKMAPQFETWIASPEDIIIKKLDFFREGGSEKHLSDIREILSSTQLDETYLNKWIQFFGLQSQWQSAQK